MTRKSSTTVTIRDIAQHAGVSVATVSRYINHTAPVSAEVAERLEQVMRQFNYTPDATARNLATRKTRIIGLLLTNIYNDFFAPLLHGIDSVVQTQGYNLLVATYHAESRDHQVLPPLGPHNTDGLLVFADSLSEKELTLWHYSDFPMVLIHRTPPSSLLIPFVTVENKAATRKLIDHLIEVHGRRQIVFMRGPEHQEDSYWRELGYMNSLQAHDLPLTPALVLRGEFERDVAYSSMKSFLTGEHPHFDAVFAGDDDSAIGVIRALQESGLRVPEDISVVGFDDLRLSAFFTPALTTVLAPTEEVGRVAAQQLFHLLSEQPVESVTLLSTELMIRRSCGCNDWCDCSKI